LTRVAGAGDNASTTGRNLPHVIDGLTWAIQCEEKLRLAVTAFDAVQGGGAVNGGLPEQFDNLSKDLQRDIEGFKSGQFGEWQDSLGERLQQFKLDKGSKIIEVHAESGHVKLSYSSELVQMMSEVRQLAALGYKLRKDVVDETATARRFYRHGMVLRQVVNFYNDIGTQMIPCQKTMMLKDAHDFEQMLFNPKDGLGKMITWSNEKALDNYIQRLQEVANKLTDKNRRLRNWHRVLGDKLCAVS
jgi:dynein heavy chain 2